MGYPACVWGGNDRKGREGEKGGSENKKLPVRCDPIYVKLFVKKLEKQQHKTPTRLLFTHLVFIIYY